MEQVSEQKFLHDVVNPLAIGTGNIKIIVGKLSKNREISSEDLLNRLKKAELALDQVTELINERRKLIRDMLTHSSGA